VAYPKLPDWLIYAAAAAAVVLVANARRENVDAPPAPPRPDLSEDVLVAPDTPLSAHAIVASPTPGPNAGTAFSVSADGRWITARHVVAGCRSVAILLGGGQAVAARVAALGSDDGDLAMLETRGGSVALPVQNDPRRVREGQRGYIVGFPAGAPGEVAVRLVRKRTLWVRRRGAGHAETVLTWAEVGRTDGLEGSLAGLSGGPVLDDQGRVLGVALAEQARRGVIFTSTPQSLAPVWATRARSHELAPGDRITTQNYGRVADSLRRELRVAEVVCLDERGAT